MTRRPPLESVLAIGGFMFMAVGLVVGWDEIAASFVWSPGGILLATLLSFGGLMSVAGSWALTHNTARREMFLAYLVLQPAKHVPGGIAHPIGLIGSSSASGAWVGSTLRFVRFSLLLVAGGLMVGATLLLESETRWWGLLSIFGSSVIGGLAVSNRAAELASRPILSLARRLSRRAPEKLQEEPHETVVHAWPAWGLAVLGILGLSLGFGILGRSFGHLPGIGILTGAFGVAWAVGYVLIPFPAGVGVRESALLLILTGLGASIGPILAVSVLQRLCQTLAELLGVVVGQSAKVGVRPQRSREQREGDD